MKTLDFIVDGPIGWIRLARPEKRNPFDAALREELTTLLERVRSDPSVRALVLTGGPGSFCAGGNLQDLHANADAGAAYWQQRIAAGLRAIHGLLHLDRPLIAVVDGPAYGAGFSLALTADMIVASPRARFAMSHLKLGLVPDLGALYMLPRVVGLQRAREIIFSTRELDAAEAHALGIVMEIHESDQLEERAREIALSLTGASPAALALTKAALAASLDADQQVMFAMEAASQAAAFSAPEPKAATEALLARKPLPFQWKSRAP